jgi:hypothetical protein
MPAPHRPQSRGIDADGPFGVPVIPSRQDYRRAATSEHSSIKVQAYIL